MNYTFISCNSLTKEYLSQLDNFADLSDYRPFYDCTDFSKIDSMADFDHYYFFTVKNTIISFISLMPIDISKTASEAQNRSCEQSRSVELTGFTLPQYRRGGLFTMLLKTVMAKLDGRNVTVHVSDKLNFSFINNSYICSDYMLGLDLSDTDLLLNLKDLYNNIAARDNTPKSSDSTPQITEYAYDSMDDSRLTQTEYAYILSDSDLAYGILKVTVTGDYACLHHVMIRRKYRGLGYGKRLLAGALNMLSEDFHGKVILHVSGGNKAAIHIYEACGFKTIQKSDTYSVTFSAL